MTRRPLSQESEIDEILATMQTVAVIGLSPRPHRPSHRVARSLQGLGVRIIPVHPCGGTLLGETVYPSLKAIPDLSEVDVIDVFRQPEVLPDLVEEVLAAYPGSSPRPVLWFQLGVTHPDAETRGLEAGLELVVDRCLLIEHQRWRDSGERGGGFAMIFTGAHHRLSARVSRGNQRTQ